MIKHFFDQSVTVRRLKTVSGNQKAFQATATADCHIQDIDRENRLKQGILEERAWVGFFDADADFTPQEGDKLTDSDGVDYKVIEVTRADYAFSINKYVEVVMIEYNE